MARCRVALFALSCLLILSLVLSPEVRATMIVPFSAEELVQRADKIFVGTCVKTKRTVGPDNRPVVEVLFAVRAALKGDVGPWVRFRQIDALSQTNPPLSGPSLLLPRLPASVLPSYTTGQEAIVFLAKAGTHGLTAPVGLSQGVWPIAMTAAGKKVVTNTTLRSIPTPAFENVLPGPGQTVSYRELETALRVLIRSRPATHKRK